MTGNVHENDEHDDEANTVLTTGAVHAASKSDSYDDAPQAFDFNTSGTFSRPREPTNAHFDGDG